VSKRGGPWDDGHRAWARLTSWHARRAGSAQGSGGDAALEAMADIGTLRRLLDQAELAAVRAARRSRRSWAEIATQLGITRQSAWERWRELDDEPALPAAPAAAQLEEPRAARRAAKTVVPNVVGMSWDDARQTLMRAGLQAAGADPDGPPLAALGWPNVLVVDQVPESGARVHAGSQVRLWLERGGGSAGVREPRRPSPAPKSGFEWRDEPSDEAVG
jgi:hypothetical protein